MTTGFRLWCVAVLSSAALACTTTYTQEQADAEGWDGDADAAAEAERDEETDEEGGTNRVRTREELDQMMRDVER